MVYINGKFDDSFFKKNLMMNLKTFFTWIYMKGSSYNLFMLEDTDYDDDPNVKDPTLVLKHQKLKTRLYVVFLTGKQTY